ncbi:hypothetical protein GGR57DRAFT_474296 [Xylariaceae sp. FL1272]|nr:hypothetical protein GGR57DRAFT_474296 [Xylariaceae sp. FL1272]
MASTRASSPGENASTPASTQLSPQSKIQALLAAVDESDSSEGEDAAPIDAKKLFASIDKKRKALASAESAQDTGTEEDDDEDEVVRPRGRLAARMQAETATAVSNPAPNSPSSSNHDLVSAEEDDDVALPRRRLARPARQATPEPVTQEEQPASPEGLFVTPSKSVASNDDVAPESDEDELPMDLSKNARFQALVAKKRKEREEREAEEERKRGERAQRLAEQMPTNSDTDDVSDISDDEGGRKLTQDVSRPTRKASKKALEEMHRETQRISRGLQLAHEAKTKKKISKASLFERFNFRAQGAATAESQGKLSSSSRPTTPGSAHQTDAEMGDAATPPSSPPSTSKDKSIAPATVSHVASGETIPTIVEEDDNAELPSLEDSLASSQLDKGKGKEIAPELNQTISESKGLLATKPKRQVRVKLPATHVNVVAIDSDDELEITQTKKGRLDAIFDRVPEKTAQESTGMKILRNLAHLGSPGKEPTRGRNVKPSISAGELHVSLQQRAKAQAKLERDRRLEALRAKGVVVQSAEEREREREQVEDIVARARQEVEEIMQRERDDAKKARREKKENGEADPLAWDESDDDSYNGSEEEQEPEEVELSGSEEEDDEGAEDENESDGSGDEGAAKDSMFLDKADEGQSGEESSEEDEDGFSAADFQAMKRSSTTNTRQRKKRAQVISDDEDEDADQKIEATPRPKNPFARSPAAPNTSSSPKAPTSVLRSATKNFIPGLPVPNAAPAGLGLTQMFAGTMDDSQAASENGSPEEFMPSLDQFPDSQFSAQASQSQNALISDSQPVEGADSQELDTQTGALKLHYSQSQAHGFDSLLQRDTSQMSQMSEFMEATQDGGFQDYTPLKQRFVDPPQSTVDTLLLAGTPDDEVIQDSPLVRKKGKLIRRNERDVSISTLPPTEIPGSPSIGTANTAEGTATSSDAFRLMEKAAKRERRLKKKFDKKKSKATEMIQEQAEESEDEYAGLGGADGEDSSDEDDELYNQMIDDTGKNDGDEAKMAGVFAEQERVADAAQVDKLFRDITTGMLRKRRRGGDGNDFDLSDSDDGGEARRRMKRRQFAKMQKALFADERIGKIAENPRNAAFLKSIEDRNSDDEWDFGDNFAAETTSTSGDDSQSQSQNQADQAIPDSQPPAGGRKRSRMDDHTRPDSKARRTQEGARPASLADVRRSLSSLLEEPNGSVGSVIPATNPESDDEDRPSTANPNKENHHPCRSTSVVDRITLKRNSSNTSTSSTGSGRLAFAAPSASGSGFKVPALLRRATTNSLMSQGSQSQPTSVTGSTTTRPSGGSLNKAGSFGGDGQLKKNAGKRSGISGFAHENERRAKVAESERRREERKWKGAEGRGKVVGGLFGGGRFE